MAHPIFDFDADRMRRHFCTQQCGNGSKFASPQHSRYGLDADGLWIGVVDDPRIVVFLWWHGKFQKCSIHDATEFYIAGRCQHALGGGWF